MNYTYIVFTKSRIGKIRKFILKLLQIRMVGDKTWKK